ncbi:AraC family transcriptional regulator [Flavobacteriaceae bacterium TP-CH-4]|uniref:AraC family transcriptional regulator n=1 Tax=Pelagihabitans pacificus TaxID=2696054 RepID=A0A967EEZ4_9FLAO|nr:helix-turn-helix domain-containing protein [Pelagihabitans pacificus]NHF60873.1 AraC family transcriptional regulator [Pelagihabitans pacificus]
MPSFNIVDVVLFLGISQGLFLSLSLQLIRDRNKASNKILSTLLLMAALMLFGRIATYRAPEEWVWRFGVLIDTTIFLFGPLIYTYVRRLLFNEIPSFMLSWFHFIPGALHLIYYLWTLSFSVTEFNSLYFSGKLNLTFFLVELAGLISFIFYWTKTFLLYRKYSNIEAGELSFHQTVGNYLKFLLCTLGLFIILWIMSFLSVNFLKKPLGYINYVTMWISTPLFIYAIGYFSLRQPGIFRIPFARKSRSELDRLKPDEIQKLQKRLRYFMEDEKIFTKPNLTLSILAEKLDTTPNNLSWLLNKIYQKSFFEYINAHRVKEFIKKLDRDEHNKHTLLALALDVGFNSKSTFNRVFKTTVGTTPKEYLKNKKVA